MDIQVGTDEGRARSASGAVRLLDEADLAVPFGRYRPPDENESSLHRRDADATTEEPFSGTYDIK